MAFEDVKEIFRTHWTIWKWMGQVTHPKYPKMYKVYSILVNIIFSLSYPVHLVIGLFQEKTIQGSLLNLTISLPSVICVLKFYNTWRNFDKVRHLEQMYNTLYARIDHPEDLTYYRKVTAPNAFRVINAFKVICVGMAITAELTQLYVGFVYGWRLMYPGYFPFDPHGSTTNYVIAHIFQFIGLLTQISQNMMSDTYGAVCLTLLAGHTNLLGKRLARIGYDKSKTQEQHNQDFVDFIVDHNMLLNCQRTLIDIIGIGLFALIISTSLLLAIVIIYPMFFVDNALEYTYYVFFMFGALMEVFPTCYYATHFEYEFENLTYKIFSCNWVDQNRAFKKNVIVCLEQSLKARHVFVGGMFRINLQIFIAICKGAYSVFTLALNYK